MHVFKFGGASVKDANAVRNLRDILKKFQNGPLVVVISAMDKTTNKLEELVKVGMEGTSGDELIAELKDFHAEVAQDLLGRPCLQANDLIDELASESEAIKGLSWVRAYDRIVPFGELLSTSIIADFLSQEIPNQWVDAREVVTTDEFFTEANIKWEITEQKAKEQLLPIVNSKLVVTQGFIGRTVNGDTTTLGREGSDFTGAILASCLDAESFTVWKDVPGILNADPKLKENAEQFDQISYREATEMTYYGAKVIHPKTLKPLAQKHIPLIVRSFIYHDKKGTQIGDQQSNQIIPTFIFKENQLLITAEVKDHSFMDEKRLAVILSELDKLNVKINLMQNSALTFSFCMDNKEHKLEPIISALSEQFNVSYNRPLKLTTVKNYTDEALAELPKPSEEMLIQKTRLTYQILYR